MSRKTRQELVIHRYQHRPCQFPHQTWSGDYAEVRKLTARELMIFINSHTQEYLALFCENTPLLDAYLETPPTAQGNGHRIVVAFTRHFQRDNYEGDTHE